jgi:hypothetical protein
MNAILTQTSLRAPGQSQLRARQRVEANGVSHSRVRPTRSANRRVWIIGSSFSAAETAVLMILAMAGLFGIGRCFSMLGSDVPTTTAPPSFSNYAAQ